METNILDKLNQNFTKTLEELKQASTNLDFFDKFIGTLTIKDVKNNIIYIVVKNLFAKQVIINDYLTKITDIFNKIENTNYVFEVLCENESKVIASKVDYQPKGTVVGVNPDYTFDNLVIGDFNNAAFIAGKSITTDHFINPLFISANVGLGKTHILHAIGNEFIKAFPDKSVKYVSSDDFSREVYNALINDDKTLIEKIKDDYNKFDLLLLDDIQILAGRTKINEVLFGIFNNNLKNKKCIVFTSDKNVDLLNGFEDRMKSRFHSGITLTIQKPNMDSLIQIIDKKVAESNNVYTFSDDAKKYIARRNNGDIRRLSGDINQIFFFAANNLEKYTVISVDVVKSIIAPESADQINKFGYDIDPEIVIAQVCASYGVKPDMVTSKSKLSSLIMPRIVCMYVLRKKFNMTFSQIGQYFSGRDHSTVMSSIEKIEKILKSDPDLKTTIENIYKKL